MRIWLTCLSTATVNSPSSTSEEDGDFSTFRTSGAICGTSTALALLSVGRISIFPLRTISRI